VERRETMNNSQGSHQQGPARQCYTCGQSGHISRECHQNQGKGGAARYNGGGGGYQGYGGGYRQQYNGGQGGQHGNGQDRGGDQPVNDNEISFGEVSSREVLMTVRVKSNQKEQLRQLLEQPPTPNKPSVVDLVADGAHQSSMSPGAKKSMEAMEKGINTLVSGHLANTDTLKNLNTKVNKIANDGSMLNKRMERLEAEQERERAKRARSGPSPARVHGYEHLWSDQEQEEQDEDHTGALRSDIAQWIIWKWKADMPGLKEIVNELGLQSIMNYRSKVKSMRSFCDAAYDMNFEIPLRDDQENEEQDEGVEEDE
jgi:hypothetical protein